MGQDVSLEIAGQISGAKVFGSSDNIRHGRYQFLIKRIFAELVDTDLGKNKMAFWEFKVLKAEANPQVEGDKGTDGKLIDDGTNPNRVGTDCALKINFDGPGARSAGANVKQAILALFNKQDGEISDEEINKTWVDLARRRSVRKGEQIGFDQQKGQPIIATEDLPANPACGMVIDCYTRAKKKRTPNEKGAYITKLIFMCAAPIGTGLNAPAEVMKRRAEIEAMQMDDEDDEATPGAPGAPGVQRPAPPSTGAVVPGMQAVPAGMMQQPQGPRLMTEMQHPMQQAQAPVTQAVPPPPPAPPAPVVAAWAPQAPWIPHPSAPGFFWSDPSLGGNNSVKSEAQLRTGQ